MAKSNKNKGLTWCEVRLGKDMLWWVEKTSDPVQWDVVDGLSILDPRQVQYIVDVCSGLMEYGFNPALIDAAFYRFHIVKDLGGGVVKLERVPDSLLHMTEPLFGLPDVIDEERGPYADLLNHLTRARVKMLNDLIDFEEHLTIDELEEDIRDQLHEEYMEGKAVHVFTELSQILEYIPEGYELEEGEEAEVPGEGEGIGDEFPDLEEESIEQDETMRWGDEEDEDDEDIEESDDDDEDDEDEDEDEERDRKSSKKKPEKVEKKKKTAPKASPAKTAKPVKSAKKPAKTAKKEAPKKKKGKR